MWVAVAGWEKIFLFPWILNPFRRLSRAGLKEFYASWKASGRVQEAIDEFVYKLPTENFTMALSTAYGWLYALIVGLRINHLSLGITPPDKMSVATLADVAPEVVGACFAVDRSWTPALQITLVPP